MAHSIGLAESGFAGLLYRYWFYDWLFRDASRGTLLERASAYRHNRERARWLPTYLRRWTVFGLACGGLGATLEAAAAPALIAAAVYLPCAVSVAVDAVTVAAWLGLRIAPAR
jgi:hypothetical protein